MCMGCWEKYGSPRIDNEITREASRAIEKVHDYGADGHMHIVIDDWNIDDGSLEFCAGDIAEDYWKTSQDQLHAESYCLGLLKNMSVDERASALAMHDKFF